MNFKWTENSEFHTLKSGSFFVVKPYAGFNNKAIPWAFIDDSVANEGVFTRHFDTIEEAKAWVEENYIVWCVTNKLEGQE